MNGIYFEDIHQASPQYPYLDFFMENINYLAHFHEEIEIIYLAEGEVDITSEEASYTAVSGDICIFMPGEIHSLSSRFHNRLFILKLMPPSKNGQEVFALMRLDREQIRPWDAHYDALKDLIFQIREEDQEKKYGFEFAVNRDVNALFLIIKRQLPFSFLPSAQRKRLNKKLEFLSDVNAYISEHYPSPIALEDAAKHLGYSKYYFAHTFKEAFQVSFVEFLTLFRLEKAASLIRLTNETITNTAYRCGFGSIRSFNRAFFKYFHQTPSQYRIDCQNDGFPS